MIGSDVYFCAECGFVSVRRPLFSENKTGNLVCQECALRTYRKRLDEAEKSGDRAAIAKAERDLMIARECHNVADEMTR